MALNPVSVNFENPNLKTDKSVSFGNFNPIIGLMDGINRGGFAANFIVQDMLGMALPRTGASLTRNSKDNDGEKNTAYARLVAIREILSGPSSFIIPAFMIAGFKKFYGRANNVPINFIKGFGDYFADFAQSNQGIINDSQKLKEGFYRKAVQNLLESSTESKLSGKEMEAEVDEFTKLLMKMDKAPKHHLWSKKTGADGKPIQYAKNLKSQFVEKFVQLRKIHSNNPSNKITKAWFDIKEGILNTDNKSITTSVDSFIGNLRDFTADMTNSISKKYKSGASIKEFVENFTHKRVGSRFLVNLSMTVAVALFFTVIPKLYNSKDGKNPALAGLEENNSPTFKIRRGK